MSKHTVLEDAGDFKAREARTIMPSGQYLLEILHTEDKPTKTGGNGIAVTLRVIGSVDGNFIGSKVDHFLNIPTGGSGESAQTQTRIFMETWKAIEPNAAGKSFDTDDWIGKKVMCNVSVIDEPWTRTDASTGLEKTTLIKKNRIGGFFPGTDWRIKTPIAAGAAASIATQEPARPAPSTTPAPVEGNVQLEDL